MLSLAVGGVLLVVIFRGVDFPATVSLIENVGYYFLPIYAVYGFGCLLDTAAWKIILDIPGKTISFGKLLQIHIAGESMYRFIPAGVIVGEGVKIFLLKKQSHFTGPQIISSLVIRKLLMGLSQGIYIGSGFFLGILLAQRIGLIEITSLSLSLFILVIFLLMGVMLSRGLLFDWAFRVLRSIPFIRGRVERQSLFFERTDIVLKDFFIHKRRKSVFACLLFFGGWLTEMLETYLILVALGTKVLLYQVMLFEPVVSLMRSLAFVLPGGLGVIDSGYLTAFASVGIGTALIGGVAFVIIKRSKELFWIIIGLVLMWLQGGKVPDSTLVPSLKPGIAPEII